MGNRSYDDFVKNTGFDVNSLAKMAFENKVEISISIDPTRTEINIVPWKPFEYHCPYHGVTTNPVYVPSPLSPEITC